MEIPPQAAPAFVGLIVLVMFLALYIWDRMTPPKRNARHSR